MGFNVYNKNENTNGMISVKSKTGNSDDISVMRSDMSSVVKDLRSSGKEQKEIIP